LEDIGEPLRLQARPSIKNPVAKEVQILLATQRMTTMRLWVVIRYCFATTALLLLSACGTEGDSNRIASDASRVVAAEDLRRDGIFQACGGGDRTRLNPWGLAGRQWQSSDGNRFFLGNLLSRALEIVRARSEPLRIVFHQPGGWFRASDDGMRGALPTIPVMNGRKLDGRELYPWRWQVWVEEISAIAAAHPDWILGVYFSGQVPTADSQDALDGEHAYEIYDHSNERHRTLMLGLVDQWMSIGIQEFVLDHTSGPIYGSGMAPLAGEIRARGGRLYMEAHPKDRERNLNIDLLGTVDGSLSTNTFMRTMEPQSKDWVVPDGSVMMVALKKDTSVDGGLLGVDTSMWTHVRDYRRRGFEILSGAPTFDEYVRRK
jgi:hypothetical protein